MVDPADGRGEETVSTNGSRPVTPAEIAWSRWVLKKDEAGLSINDAELDLLRYIMARSKAAESQRGQTK